MRTPRITRREFLVRTAGAAAGLEVARSLNPPGVTAAPAGEWPSAAVCQGTDKDSAAAILKTALDAIGGIGRFVKPGQTVAIKPNATWDYPPGTASSTDPELLKTLILMVQEAGAKRIIVLDHPTLSSAAECLKVSGIGAVLDKLDVEKVFPDRFQAAKEFYTPIAVPKGKVFPKIGVIKAATEADVRINMAVAKSHLVLPVTLCLKHMMGFLENPPALHAGLEQGIVDINTECKIACQLHILEAIRVRLPVGSAKMAAGNDNEITNPRRVKRLNQIVAGTDPVLIDSYACINYFSVQPKEIRYIRMAGEQGLGEMDVAKATGDGRLRIFKAGQPVTTPAATPTATPSPTATPTRVRPAATETPRVVGTPTPTSPPPTNTPLPTPTLDPEALNTPIPQGALASQQVDDVLNPNRLLSGALLPVAAILTGTGVVVGRRLRKQDEARPKGSEASSAAESDNSEPADGS